MLRRIPMGTSSLAMTTVLLLTSAAFIGCAKNEVVQAPAQSDRTTNIEPAPEAIELAPEATTIQDEGLEGPAAPIDIFQRLDRPFGTATTRAPAPTGPAPRIPGSALRFPEATEKAMMGQGMAPPGTWSDIDGVVKPLIRRAPKESK